MALGLADRERKREFGVILFHELGLHASNLCLELGGVAVGQGPTEDVGSRSYIVYLIKVCGRNSIN